MREAQAQELVDKLEAFIDLKVKEGLETQQESDSMTGLTYYGRLEIVRSDLVKLLMSR